MAAVQRASITREQTSTLFWINLAVGALLGQITDGGAGAAAKPAAAPAKPATASPPPAAPAAAKALSTEAPLAPSVRKLSA